MKDAPILSEGKAYGLIATCPHCDFYIYAATLNECHWWYQMHRKGEFCTANPSLRAV